MKISRNQKLLLLLAFLAITLRLQVNGVTWWPGLYAIHTYDFHLMQAKPYSGLPMPGGQSGEGQRRRNREQ